jgi:response regulator of citrate/malate metabolism
MRKAKEITVKVTLNDGDKTTLKSILAKGIKSVRVIKRAMVLNLFDQGYPSPEIAKSVGVSPETARRIAHNYNNEGIIRAL